MSSATPSRQAPLATDERSIVTAGIDRLTYGVRATAFWTATVLPLFILAALAVGAIGEYPLALVGALAVNAVCAVVGHDHASRQQ
jgi:hypothetical protein